jgi:hypothetical protein
VAGEHPHRNAKLLECLLDGGERRNGSAASVRSSALAAVTGKLRALRVFSGGRWLRLRGEARARGALNRVAASLGMRAQDAAWVGWRRTAVRLGLESEPVTGKGTVLTDGTHPSVRERGREEEVGRAGDAGPGEGAGPRGGVGARREVENGPRGGAGLHSEERKEEGVGSAGLGCKVKKIGKLKRESGPGPIRKRERKGIVSKCI